MQLQFDSFSELGEPGSKFESVFNTYWPAYSAWLDSSSSNGLADLKTSQAALKKYMPELFPVYEKLCTVVNADLRAANFLTGYRPPGNVTACSQAVLSNEQIRLVRNYDYHPDLIEGIFFLSEWNGKKVMGTSDCLIGLLDGVNEDGLAVSLTYGGRKVVGDGFGIPIILRYVLEFCSDVNEAVKALKGIPSHMSYNVTVLDRTGNFKTVLLSPDREPVITDNAFTTNHQGSVDWEENAEFNKTLERSCFLENLLEKEDLNAEKLSEAFLNEPLYNIRYNEGFGTLYTAIYNPVEGNVVFRWPAGQMVQSFDDFNEGSKVIQFVDQIAVINRNSSNINRLTESLEYIENDLTLDADEIWREAFTNAIQEAIDNTKDSGTRKRLEKLYENFVSNKELSNQNSYEYWAKLNGTYSLKNTAK